MLVACGLRLNGVTKEIAPQHHPPSLSRAQLSSPRVQPVGWFDYSLLSSAPSLDSSAFASSASFASSAASFASSISSTAASTSSWQGQGCRVRAGQERLHVMTRCAVGQPAL